MAPPRCPWRTPPPAGPAAWPARSRRRRPDGNQRAQSRERQVSDSAHATEVVDGAEDSALRAAVENPRCESGADAGETLEILLARAIEVEARPDRHRRGRSGWPRRSRRRCRWRRHRRAVEGFEAVGLLGVRASPPIDSDAGAGDEHDDEEQRELASRVQVHAATMARAPRSRQSGPMQTARCRAPVTLTR